MGLFFYAELQFVYGTAGAPRYTGERTESLKHTHGFGCLKFNEKQKKSVKADIWGKTCAVYGWLQVSEAAG